MCALLAFEDVIFIQSSKLYWPSTIDGANGPVGDRGLVVACLTDKYSHKHSLP